MLRYLKIRDFALIRNLEIEFGPGLNLLTGETGSGKSIIVDALGLLLGDRSSQEMVRSNCEIAVIEGMFAPDSTDSIAEFLAAAGMESDDNEILIRREISASGRNRIFINNNLATLSILKAIGERLADIHGQHDQKSLLDLDTHLEWLDRYGKNTALAEEVARLYRRLREIALRLDSMAENEQERLRRIDILQFQVNEIRRSNLKAREREELDNEKNILSNHEKLFGLANEAYALLYDSESALLTQVRRLERIVQELGKYDSDWLPHHEVLRDSLYKLEDAAYLARGYAGKIDFSPERLDQVQQRLAELDRLSKKYGTSIDDILNYCDQREQELAELLSYADTSKILTAEFAEAEERYRVSAAKLSEKRHKDAVRLGKEVRKEFQALSMEKMEMGVFFGSAEVGEKETKRISASYGPAGFDHVEFMIAPNKGEEARPLARIASGGELSRIMLAIKSLCGDGDFAKTLVFDEVDAGIGGRVAESVGRRLRAIASRHQVLCVTHLPQIAAFAERHYHVRKDVIGSRTETLITLVNSEDRVQEIARMLGGEIITETTRKHAREMLEHSAEDSPLKREEGCIQE